MKLTRSVLVSWLLGATFVGLVTFSFEALSAREAPAARCPVTGATSAARATTSSTCPAMTAGVRCPAAGAMAMPAPASARCPVSGSTTSPVVPPGRCPAGGDASGLARPGLRV